MLKDIKRYIVRSVLVFSLASIIHFIGIIVWLLLLLAIVRI